MTSRPLSLVSIGAVLLAMLTSSVASASTVAPRAGTPCKTVGRIAGQPPNQVVCQRSGTKRPTWIRRATTGTTSGSVPATASRPQYASAASPESAASTLALLNEQGRKGFAYVGPMFLGGASHELFVKAEPGATYVYEVLEKTPTESTRDGLLALLNAKGSAGFVFKTPAFFIADSPTTYFVFVKNATKQSRYSYRTSAWPTDEATTVRDLNVNGADGYGYIGDIIPSLDQPTVGVRVFVKDERAPAQFAYTLKPLLDDRSQLLAEINAMGKSRATWKGGYVFDAGTAAMQSRTLYETSSLTTTAVSCTFESPVPTTISALIASANTQASNGRLHRGQWQVGTDTVSISCNGPLTNLPLVGVVLP